jgi:hypothetical protein
MPGRVPLAEMRQKTGGKQAWHKANTRREACPQGFSQEATIKAIWEGT